MEANAAQWEPGPAAAAEEQLTGVKMLWGGVILGIENRPDETWIEVLAFPLDSRGRPRVDNSPQGRYFAVQPGYLEPADYQPGRQLLTLGLLSEILEGRIGEAEYRYPRLDVDSLHLWPRNTSASGGDSSTRFHFGIGIGIGL